MALLIGRKREMAALAEAAAAARRALPQYVLVSGPAGIGKTRLVAEIAEHCAEAGDLVVRGVCVEAGREVALLPLVAPFAALVAARAEDVRASSPVRDLVHGRELTGAAEGRLARLAEDAYRLLAAGGGSVLIVDDVHWADASTAAVLEYLARRAEPGARLCLIATARAPHPLPEALTDGLVYRRIELEGLADADAVDLAAAAAPQPLSVRALERIVPRAAGNPLYLSALARAGADELPQTLAAALGARLDGLSPTARSLADALAVLGRPADHTVAFVVAGLDDTDGVAALREARAAGLVAATEVALTHPLLIETALASLPAPVANRLHARAADALAAAPAAQRTRHLAHARRYGEALAASLEAAANAVGSGAYAEQAAHLVHALDLWDSTPEGSARVEVDRYGVTVDAARASWLVGDRERTGELGAAAVELAEGTEQRAMASLWHGMYLEELGRGEEAARAWRRGAALVGADAPAELRHFSEHALGRAALVEGDPDAALAHARTSLTAAASATSRAHAQTFLGRVLGFLGRVEEGHTALVEACATVSVAVPATGDPSWAGHAFVFCAESALALDRLEETTAIAAQGIALLRAAGAGGRFEPDLRGAAAAALAELGHLADAEAMTRRSGAFAVGDDLTRVRLLVAARRGRPEELADTSPTTFRTGWGAEPFAIASSRAEALLLMERPDHALAELLACVPTPLPLQEPDRLRHRWLQAWAIADLHRGALAEPLVHAFDSAEIRMLVALAAAEEARGVDAADAEPWRAAAKAAEAARRPYHAAYARFREAGAELASRRRGAAASVLAHARAEALVIDAQALVTLIDALAERHGLGAAAKQPKGPLTAREQEVLALVAEGLSNAEIAERLVISPRTAAHHVGHILAALDAPNRSAAVAEARRRSLL